MNKYKNTHQKSKQNNFTRVVRAKYSVYISEKCACASAYTTSSKWCMWSQMHATPEYKACAQHTHAHFVTKFWRQNLHVVYSNHKTFTNTKISKNRKQKCINYIKCNRCVPLVVPIPNKARLSIFYFIYFSPISAVNIDVIFVEEAWNIWFQIKFSAAKEITNIEESKMHSFRLLKRVQVLNVACTLYCTV